MNLSEQFDKTGDIPLFAKPHDIINSVNMIDIGSSLHHLYPEVEPWNTTNEHRAAAKKHLMSRKYDEASENQRGSYPNGHSGGLTSEIVDRGYDWSKPIKISVDNIQPAGHRLTLEDGHHRLAVMAHLHPEQFVPIHVVHIR
jgi:hypothetical protein